MNFIAKKKRISAKNFYLKIQFLIVVLAFIFFTNPAYSAFNEQINYQGKLTDSSNQAVSDGSYNMEFKLYNASSGGTLLWTETCTSTNKITIDNGLFSHLLGSVNVLPDDIFNQNVWLSVNIGSTTTEPVWDGEMSPRKKLGSVPSSFESKRLSGKLESEFADISETENISGLWTFSATTTLATTTIASSTITALNAVSLNVNGTSSTLWDQAYHYFNASSTNLNTTHFIVNASSSNWDWTHDYVFASSTNWDAAYHWGDHSLAGYLTTVDISANTNLTVTATGLQLSGDSIALSDGYNIPTNASTTAWNSSTYATEQGSGKWNSAYSQAHATATENITGIDLTGQLFSLTDGYIIPLSASTTNWNNFYDTPSTRITAGDHIDWSGNTLNVLDDWWNALSDMTLTQGYVYVGNSSNNPVATSTLFISGQKVGVATSTVIGALSIEGGMYLGPTTTAPTTANGMMYYNATENKFKCYQNSAWVDCITAASTLDGSGTSTQIAYWSDSNTLTSTSSFVWDNTNGRLGIGSTPSTTFQVYGTSTLRDIVPDATLTYNLGASTTRWNNAWISNIYLGTSTWVISQAKDGRVQFLNNAESGKEIFTIASNGNVGVGTSTPASNFSIDGGLLLAPTTTVPLAVNGSMYYDSTDGKFKCYQAGSWTNCIGTGGTGEPAGSDSYVQYNNSGSFGGEKTFVWDDTNDRMGIGTSTPTSSLEIFSSTTNPILTISSGENASSYDPRIRLSAGLGMPVAKFNIGYDYSDDMFRIVAGDTITANKGLEITPLLEVGVGTSSRPTYSLNTIDAYFEGDTNFDGLGTFNNGLNITRVLSVTGLLLVTGDIGYSGTIIDINPDLAEKFPTKDKTIEPGDVVASDVFNKEHVIKTDKEYQLNAMGVVSTKPGIILGGLIDGGGVNVALAGRIPVKINLNNGEIKAGDYLTSSDIPGIAMKATKAGKVLGIALEDFSQSDFDNGKDRITMFVDPQFIGNDLVIASDSTGQITTQYQLTLQDIQNQLSSIGIILNQDGYFEAKTIKAKKMITEQIELIDKTTQELHCIWYENGVRHEEIGACKDVLEQQVNSSADLPQDTTSSLDSQTTETTTTQETSSSTQTTPDNTEQDVLNQTNQQDVLAPEETQQTLPPETVLEPEPEPATEPVEAQPQQSPEPEPAPNP